MREFEHETGEFQFAHEVVTTGLMRKNQVPPLFSFTVKESQRVYAIPYGIFWLFRG